MEDFQAKFKKFYSIIMYLGIYSKIRMYLPAKVECTIFSRTLDIWKNYSSTGTKMKFNSNKMLEIHAIPFVNYQLLKTNTNYIDSTIPLVLRDYFIIKLFNLINNNKKINLKIKYAQNFQNIASLKSKSCIQEDFIYLKEFNFQDFLNFPTGHWVFNFDGGQFKIPAFHGSLIKDALLKYENPINVVSLDTISGKHSIKNISPRFYILEEDLNEFNSIFNFMVINNFHNMVKDMALYKKCKENQINFKNFKEKNL